MFLDPVKFSKSVAELHRIVRAAGPAPAKPTAPMAKRAAAPPAPAATAWPQTASSPGRSTM